MSIFRVTMLRAKCDECHDDFDGDGEYSFVTHENVTGMRGELREYGWSHDPNSGTVLCEACHEARYAEDEDDEDEDEDDAAGEGGPTHIINKDDFEA